MVIGIVVGVAGSFYGGLAYIGGVALIGTLSYVFIASEVHRVAL